MPVVRATEQLVAGPAPASPVPVARARWDSLDVLRGLALCWMIAHHFAKWTGGDIRARFIGFDGLVLTDLAAPMFAVGVGAAALLVGGQIRRDRTRARRAALRWGQVLALGLVIDLVVDGDLEGGGVLPTLALLGIAVTAASAVGVCRPVTWWAVAAGCVVAAVPVTAGSSDGFLAALWAGGFSVVVYGVFAAAGAALAATAGRGGEERLPLLRAAAGVVVVGALAAWLVPSLVAPEGLWPPDRYPGDLSFTLWGLAASLVVWAALRTGLPTTTVLGAGLARAGRRTLLVFGAHFVVRVVLGYTDLVGELDSRRWGVVTWLAIAAACAAAMAPSPGWWRRSQPQAEEARATVARLLWFRQ